MTDVHIATLVDPITPQFIETINRLIDDVRTSSYSHNETPTLRLERNPTLGNGGGGYDIILSFADPDHAMLFKLTWGGAA